MKVIVDLDNTLFHTSDKYGNHIWAKQLVQPFAHVLADNVEKIVDDVGSACILRPDAKPFLNELSRMNCQVGFISNGRAFALEERQQSSLVVLNMFGLMPYFNLCRILQYKTACKIMALRTVCSPDECFFVDDDDKILAALRAAGARVVDAKQGSLSMESLHA